MQYRSLREACVLLLQAQEIDQVSLWGEGVLNMQTMVSYVRHSECRLGGCLQCPYHLWWIQTVAFYAASPCFVLSTTQSPSVPLLMSTAMWLPNCTSISKLFAYLFIRTFHATGVWPNPSQKSEVRFRYSTWVARPQIFESPRMCISRNLASRWEILRIKKLSNSANSYITFRR